jgi:hypothetical protein
MPSITEQVRSDLDRTLGAKGSYVSEESAYRFVFSRTDVALRVGAQRLSAAQAPKSWATFSPSMHSEAMVNGEVVLLEDEVNPVITVALKSGLDVTGLGQALLFEQPRLFSLSVTGQGTYQTLSEAVRKTLNEIPRLRAAPNARPPAGGSSAQVSNTIDATPLNAILSMRGSAPDGIYRAAIGRTAVINGTPIGREMGMRTTVSIFGTNEKSFLDAEIVVGPEELRRVLMALRSKSLDITSIRNHTIAEHPPALFVRVWSEGVAADLAKRLRYALDVQVGAVRLPAQ